jgi:hypothetical protein
MSARRTATSAAPNESFWNTYDRDPSGRSPL